MNLKSEKESLKDFKNSEKESILEKDLKNAKLVEEKLNIALSYMKKSLSQEKEPNFKIFWEAKKKCLDFFKENLNPHLREKFWKAYIEYSDEAKKLKDIFNEQSAFAIEQLDIAIVALESDVVKFEDFLQKLPDVKFPKNRFFDIRNEKYLKVQKRLNLLNIFSTRINALRKEIIKTEMRIRTKAKFLKKLSILGDKIFPERKELIKEVSEKFQLDISEFLKMFSKKSNSFHVLKEIIKTLQHVAKILTLNTKSFTKTRLKLSEKWDEIKEVEKKGVKEKKRQLKGNFEKASEKIKDFKEKVKNFSFKESEKEKNNILKFMKDMPISKKDTDKLKKDLFSAFGEKENKEKEKRQNAFKEKQKKKDKIKEKIKSVIEKEEKYSLEKVLEEKEILQKEIKTLDLTKMEAHIFEKLLKPFKDIIAGKKEKKILENLSEDDKIAICEMKKVLENMEKRKSEIKERLEKYRNILGGSNFDIEQGFMYRKMFDMEKENFEKIKKSINNIEKKINSFEA